MSRKTFSSIQSKNVPTEIHNNPYIKNIEQNNYASKWITLCDISMFCNRDFKSSIFTYHSNKSFPLISIIIVTLGDLISYRAGIICIHIQNQWLWQLNGHRRCYLSYGTIFFRLLNVSMKRWEMGIELTKERRKT